MSSGWTRASDVTVRTLDRRSPGRYRLRMPRPPRLRRLTISLLKAGLERGDALRAPDDLRGFVVPAIDAERESLFVAARNPHSPWWKEFLDEHVDGDLDDLWTASSSAVLLLAAADRL